MIISSSNKTINTYPLLNLLREGENNADTVTIQLPLQYGDVDLSQLSYTIYGTTCTAQASETLTKIVNGDHVLLKLAKMEELEQRVRALETGSTEPGEAYPDYVVGKWYYSGDKITFEGVKYKCIAPDGAVCTWSPTEYPTYWELVM